MCTTSGLKDSDVSSEILNPYDHNNSRKRSSPAEEDHLEEVSQTLKQITFLNMANSKFTALSWPNALVTMPVMESSKISELGRIFITHLNKSGIIHSTLDSPSFPMKAEITGTYFECSLSFYLRYGLSKYKILLNLVYSYKDNTANKTITEERIAQFLTDKIIMHEENSQSLVQMACLQLQGIQCYINGLHLEI